LPFRILWILSILREGNGALGVVARVENQMGSEDPPIGPLRFTVVKEITQLCVALLRQSEGQTLRKDFSAELERFFPIAKVDDQFSQFNAIGAAAVLARGIGVTPPFVKNCTLSREPEVTTAPELL